jgi:four helix bundle protein
MLQNKKYDLEERTAKFGESIIKFVNGLGKNDVNRILASQMVRSATSIGANYMEANGASSKKDFKNKISICRKEARETKYWLRMIAENNQDKKEDCRALWQEAQELTLIFSKIAISTSEKTI